MFNLGSIITAGAGLLTGGLNSIFQKKQQDKSWAKQVEFWNMQNEYNTPANQMKRFQDAGLNPNLIYGQGNPGNASNTPNFQVSAHTSPVGAALEALTSVANLELIKSQVEKNQSESIRTQSQTKGIDLENKFNSNTFLPRFWKVTAEAGTAVNKKAMSDIDRQYYSAIKEYSFQTIKTNWDMMLLYKDNLSANLDVTRINHKLKQQEYQFRSISNTLSLEAQRLGLKATSAEIEKCFAQINNIIVNTDKTHLENEMMRYARGEGYWKYIAAGSIGTRLFTLDAMLNGTTSPLKYTPDQWKFLKNDMRFKGLKGPLGSNIGTFGQILNGIWSDFSN